ncbi:MAG: hypothetical protein AB7N24_23695 [Dehalococcoidia bacterium]
MRRLAPIQKNAQDEIRSIDALLIEYLNEQRHAARQYADSGVSSSRMLDAEDPIIRELITEFDRIPERFVVLVQDLVQKAAEI